MSEGPNAKTPITSRPPVNILDTFQSKKKKAALNMTERIIYSNTFEGRGVGTYLRGGLIYQLYHLCISSPYRTQIQGGKDQGQEIGGHAAGDLKQFIQTSSW